MANSWQTEVGAAGQVTVNVNIPYMQKADISVYANGSQIDGITWDSDTVVHLPAALKGGEEILVMRRTERDSLRIQFSEGAAFDRVNLDEQNTQFLYLSQELVEGRSIEGFYGDISMNTFRITNLGKPVYGTDAANKNYVDAEVQEVNKRALRVPEASVAVAPTIAGRKNKLLGFDSTGAPVSATPIEGSATELELQLKDIDGYSTIGRARSIAELKTIAPQYDRCTVSVMSYVAGGLHGGGLFEYLASDTTSAEDGGLMFVGLNGARWRRVIELDELHVGHFGAVLDGVTDDAAAMLRMHNWSHSTYSTNGPGIVIPPGKIAWSKIDLGTAEIPSFKLKGPEVEFGVAPKLQVYQVAIDGDTTTPMVQYKARRTEITGMKLYTGTRPWFVNTVTRGAYVRIKSIVCQNTNKRVFQFIDTIDCKIDQIYSYGCKSGIVWVTWSNENPGVWDHPTAIELTNANFSSQKGEFAFSAIRCGQSIMRNVWFTACERGFDVSQGGWVFDTVIAEGPSTGGTNFAGEAKIVEISTRFAQGATVGREVTDTGWTAEMDMGGDTNNGGKKPSWVTNSMDQGRLQLNTAGVVQRNGMEYGYQLPLPDMRFLNNTGNEKWIKVGQVICNNTLGATFELELQGANGYDNIGSSTNHPGSTGFGGGRALIRGQLKYPQASTTAIQLSWHGEGACPIKEVRYVHSWQNFEIYVRVGAFTRVIGAFLRGDGVGRNASGSPFYFKFGSDDAVDISTVAATVARKVWSINGGTAGTGQLNTGLGMDLDSGQLLLAHPEVGNAATMFLNVKNNYSDRYIPIQDQMQSIRIPRYTLATMPKATDNPYGTILVSDAVSGNGVTTWRQCFSNGSFWFTADGATNLGAGS